MRLYPPAPTTKRTHQCSQRMFGVEIYLRAISFMRSNIVCFFFGRWILRSIFNAAVHIDAHAHTNMHTYAHTHTRSHALKLTRSPAHPLTRSHAQTYTPTHVHTHIHAHSRTHIRAHAHTRTHLRALTHAHIHTHEQWWCGYRCICMG